MTFLRITGQVDDQHRLTANVPRSIGPGEIEVFVAVPAQEDDAGEAWMMGVANQWHADLSDSREDIYTLHDGEPIDGSG